MESMCIFLIAIVFLVVRAGTMKNKMPQNQKRDINSNPQYEDIKPRERRSHRPNRKTAKYSAPKEAEQPSDIELRRMEQHEKYNRSRIHRNVHKEVKKPEPEQVTINTENTKLDTNVSEHINNTVKKEIAKDYTGKPAINMNDLRDNIVCGYPTEIPNQRDFVKEGEEFLANLGVSSMFI